MDDLISRQQAITALRALSDDDGYINAPHEVVTDVVRGLPPVKVKQGRTVHSEQPKKDKFGVKTGETYKDTISRQDAIYALDEIESEVADGYGFQYEKWRKHFTDLPSAQPDSKKTSFTHKALDTISRQDAITKLKEHRKIFCKNRLDFTILPDKDKARVDEIDACIAALINLPPAEQEIIRCKNCKYRDENWRRVSVKWLPCMDVQTPNNWFCGSAERGEQDDEQSSH